MLLIPRIATPLVEHLTGSYQLSTLIEDATFLGTFEIPKDFMKKSAKLYYEDNVFRFSQKMELKLYIV